MLFENPYILAAIGGAIIGLSAGLLYLFYGRTAGISSMVRVAGFENPIQNNSFNFKWEHWFLIGLVASGVAYGLAFSGKIPSLELSNGQLIFGGLLVGVGTSLANGCTSGHGVVGLAKLSPRSLVAVLTFMTTAIITVFLSNFVRI